MTPKNLLFVIRQTPYGPLPGKEIVDALLACSAYGQNISILFINDGVFHLSANQQAQLIKKSSVEKMLSALAIYDIDEIYACEESVALRNITLSGGPLSVTLLDRSKINTLMSKQDKLLSF